jgi:DNA topoisomerase I
VPAMPRLRRSDSSMPGIRRRGRGRGFEYLLPDGRRLVDPAGLERIRSLAIPPAWKDVWICPDPWGHLQAVGVDAAGRKQYLYHERWRTRRDQAKFGHMLMFARALPELRRGVARDLRQREMTRERVLGCAVRLLDRGFFRIGSESYAEENQTYGLATLQKRHVRVSGSTVTFDYEAKGGARRVQDLEDSQAARVIELLKARRGGGSELLAYRRGRRWVDLRSADINDYIKERAGEEFTAKDFRTWNATLLAAVGLATSDEAGSQTGRKRVVSAVVRAVAEYLGNTPAVARASYIDPRIFDRYRAGVTIAPALADLGPVELDDVTALQGAVEEAVIELLDGGTVAEAA